MFKRFSGEFCIRKSNRFFSIDWVSQSKKFVWKKKCQQNLDNASFNRATTKKFWPIVNPELGASGNVVLTWPLTSWFLFTGLFFILKSPSSTQKWFFWINFIRILWFIWDLGLVLFYSHKKVVSGTFLVLAIFWVFQG